LCPFPHNSHHRLHHIKVHSQYNDALYLSRKKKWRSNDVYGPWSGWKKEETCNLLLLIAIISPEAARLTAVGSFARIEARVIALCILYCPDKVALLHLADLYPTLSCYFLDLLQLHFLSSFPVTDCAGYL
jgi:hypothetical protein